MANYSTAATSPLQYKVNELMKRPENKHKPSTALMYFLKNRDLLVPASEREAAIATKNSDQDTVYVNILNKQSISTGSARAAAHSGSINDSTRVTQSFTTIAANFKYSLKGADRNIWKLEEQIAQQLISACVAIHSDVETAALAYLSTNKSQVVVSASPRSGIWDGSNYIFKISLANYDLFLQKLKGFMREQYYKGIPIDLILDEVLFQKAEYMANQGNANATNLGWQMGGLNFDASEEISAVENYLGTGYAIPAGTYGVLDWIPTLNREGKGSIESVTGRYSTIQDPLGSGLMFAVHELASLSDNESAAGETQDVDVNVEVSFDYSFMKAPMSTSNLTPIFNFGVLDS